MNIFEISIELADTGDLVEVKYFLSDLTNEEDVYPIIVKKISLCLNEKVSVRCLGKKSDIKNPIPEALILE